MVLTKEEREKFVEYLNQSAADAEGLAKQCTLINQPLLARKYENEAVAYRIVALSLHVIEDSSV